MRLLLCTPDLPYPPQKGTALRNYHLLAHLAQQHTMHLLSFAEPDQEGALEALRAIGATAETVLSPQPRSILPRLLGLAAATPDLAQRRASFPFAQRLQTLLAEPWDVVQFEGLEMGPYLAQARQLVQRPRPSLVLDEHNAEYRLQELAFGVDRASLRRWPIALWSWVQAGKLRAYERLACQRADAVVAVSSEDAEALRALSPGLEVTVIPNGLDLSQYPPPQRDQRCMGDPPILLFTGTMDYRPNVDAMVWFSRAVLPLIRRRLPLIQLQIVGRSPVGEVRGLASSAVLVTGDVPEVGSFFAQADVYVVPLRMGSGTRFKVLEAMASGVPVVSTSLGIAGLSAHPGVEYLLADTAEEFAEAVVALLEQPHRRQQLAEAGRQLVARFGWSAILPALDQLYQRLQRNAPRSGSP